MEKNKYTAPVIEIILMDSEISLALQSNPPIGPDESANNRLSPDNLNDDPVRSTFG
jgi:hypothetical protein